MTQRFASKSSVLLAALLVGTVSASVALCQPPGGGPGGPGGRGPGGPGGFGGRGGGGGPMGGMRQLSPVQTPASALASGLKLTDDQQAQIQSIQDKLKAQRDSLMPRPGQDGGERPDPETMRAAFDKLRTAEQKANKDIEALLTATQKAALPALLRQLDGMRQLGIPLEVLGDLKLTAAQKTQLNAIAKKAADSLPKPGQGRPGDGGPGGPPDGGGPGQGGRGFGGPGGGQRGRGEMDANRQKFHEQAMAVLTDAQKQQVQEFMEAHPRPDGGPGRRGFGGPGGPGGFGGDGPPPPPPDGNGDPTL